MFLFVVYAVQSAENCSKKICRSAGRFLPAGSKPEIIGAVGVLDSDGYTGHPSFVKVAQIGQTVRKSPTRSVRLVRCPRARRVLITSLAKCLEHDQWLVEPTQ